MIDSKKACTAAQIRKVLLMVASCRPGAELEENPSPAAPRSLNNKRHDSMFSFLLFALGYIVFFKVHVHQLTVIRTWHLVLAGRLLGAPHVGQKLRSAGVFNVLVLSHLHEARKPKAQAPILVHQPYGRHGHRADGNALRTSAIREHKIEHVHVRTRLHVSPIPLVV